MATKKRTSGERPSNERYFGKGKMVVPDICVNGMPGYLYTGATCMAALLLLFEQDRQLVEESCESRYAMLELFECDAFKEIINGRLFHHHHNPTMAQIMVQIGLKTIVILPDPSTIFSNLSRPHIDAESSSVTSGLKSLKEWLEIATLCETSPHLIVLQDRDIEKNPRLIAEALARLELIRTSHSQSSLDVLYCYAKCMIPEMMEACYGEDFQLEHEFVDKALGEQEARIKAFTERHPIAHEIQELHREVTSRLQVDPAAP
jgi:hypothetical protein